MGGLISALGAFLSNNSVLKFLAIKTLLYTLLVVVAPIVIWNLGIEWTETVLNWAMSSLPTGSYIYSATGLAGWFLITFKIPEAVSVLVSALAARMILVAVLR